MSASATNVLFVEPLINYCFTTDDVKNINDSLMTFIHVSTRSSQKADDNFNRLTQNAHETQESVKKMTATLEDFSAGVNAKFGALEEEVCVIIILLFISNS